MATTYEKIATTTLSSSQSSFTFSSIPSTYTDIRLIITAIGAGASAYVAFQLNGDTSSNYSTTFLRGSGSAASSSRQMNQVRGFILNGSDDLPTTYPALSITDIFSYAGTTYKTLLSMGLDDKNGSGEINSIVNLWRSTSAITSITVIGYNTNLAAGTSATLYGIKAA